MQQMLDAGAPFAGALGGTGGQVVGAGTGMGVQHRDRRRLAVQARPPATPAARASCSRRNCRRGRRGGSSCAAPLPAARHERPGSCGRCCGRGPCGEPICRAASICGMPAENIRRPLHDSLECLPRPAGDRIGIAEPRPPRNGHWHTRDRPLARQAQSPKYHASSSSMAIRFMHRERPPRCRAIVRVANVAAAACVRVPPSVAGSRSCRDPRSSRTSHPG